MSVCGCFWYAASIVCCNHRAPSLLLPLVCVDVLSALSARHHAVTHPYTAQEDHSLSFKDYWDSSVQGKVHVIAGAYLACQAAWFGWYEAAQLVKTGLWLYFKSGWNTLDLTSIALMLIIVPLHWARVSILASQAVGPMIAFEVLLIWFKLFFYALAFEPTGPVVHRVFQITFALRAWVVLLFMNIVAFATSLMVLSQYTLYDASFRCGGSVDFACRIHRLSAGAGAKMDAPDCCTHTSSRMVPARHTHLDMLAILMLPWRPPAGHSVWPFCPCSKPSLGSFSWTPIWVMVDGKSWPSFSGPASCLCAT